MNAPAPVPPHGSWLSWDKLKDILTILVIPALVWVSSVSTDLEVLRLKVDSQTELHQKLEAKVDAQEARSVATSERLARLEARLESIGERINEIRDLLLSRSRSSGSRRNP